MVQLSETPLLIGRFISRDQNTEPLLVSWCGEHLLFRTPYQLRLSGPQLIWVI